MEFLRERVADGGGDLILGEAGPGEAEAEAEPEAEGLRGRGALRSATVVGCSWGAVVEERAR